MKKIHGKKLALSRETLATLSPDALDGVNGGQVAGGLTPQITRPVTRFVCPIMTRAICPPSLNRVCAGGNGGGNAEGQG